jgi:hypothetical protein
MHAQDAFSVFILQPNQVLVHGPALFCIALMHLTE